MTALIGSEGRIDIGGGRESSLRHRTGCLTMVQESDMYVGWPNGGVVARIGAGRPTHNIEMADEQW